MKKITITITAIAILAVTLTGCRGVSEPPVGVSPDAPRVAQETRYFEVTTPNGPLPCVVFDGIKAGGITCDWEAVR